MAKLQKNTIGFYPKVNSIDEEISININSAYQIEVNKTPTTIVEVYYKNILLETTTKSIINLPKELINLSDSDEIQIKTYKKVFNFVMKAQTRTINLKALTCCSEEDSITISCSDTFTCV
jgi:hypothetical protein